MFLTCGSGCWQCSENEELQNKVNLLEQQLASLSGDKLSLSSEQGIPEEYADELRKKVQYQVNTYCWDCPTLNGFSFLLSQVLGFNCFIFIW